MKVILNAGALPERYSRVVAAMGVFDGVHRGHQAVISRAVKKARRINGASVVITFSPHPVEVLRPGQFNGYVISLEHRILLIKALGVDVCYVVPFSRLLANLSAADFVQRFLIDKLRVKEVVVGEDFSFGHDRQGSVDFFAGHGIRLEKAPLLKSNNKYIKTRVIKNLVTAGNLPRLKAFLGRDYGMYARVVRGSGVGRKLGFPTANLYLENVIALPSGIYAVRILVGHKKYNGVFYIGTRPTLKKQVGVLSLEAHILDFKGSIYGQKISVDFCKKLRNECIFSDDDALVRAISRDVLEARAYFLQNPF